MGKERKIEEEGERETKGRERSTFETKRRNFPMSSGVIEEAGVRTQAPKIKKPLKSAAEFQRG